MFFLLLNDSCWLFLNMVLRNFLSIWVRAKDRDFAAWLFTQVRKGKIWVTRVIDKVVWFCIEHNSLINTMHWVWLALLNWLYLCNRLLNHHLLYAFELLKLFDFSFTYVWHFSEFGMILMGFINTEFDDFIVKIIDFFRINIGISSFWSLRNLVLLSSLPLVMLIWSSFVNTSMIGRRKGIMKIVINYFCLYYWFCRSVFNRILRLILNNSCFFTASYKIKSFSWSLPFCIFTWIFGNMEPWSLL